jgi:hypothetical protein
MDLSVISDMLNIRNPLHRRPSGRTTDRSARRSDCPCSPSDQCVTKKNSYYYDRLKNKYFTKAFAFSINQKYIYSGLHSLATPDGHL